jgi:PAS domain S-box-containing protein
VTLEKGPLDSFNLLEILLDNDSMGIVILDHELIVWRFNPTWAEFVTEYSATAAEQITPGESFFDLLPGTRAAYQPLFERVLAGETVHQEAFRQQSGGHVSYWDSVTTPLQKEGNVAGLVHVAIDVTERVRSAQKLESTLQTLRERETRLDLVMKGTNDGIWDWNLETDEVYYSPRWKAMLGYEVEEIENHFKSWRKLIHPDDVERAQIALDAHFSGKSDLYHLEHRLRHKSGEYHWILARGISIRDERGKPVRMVGSHTDITQQKLAEEALRESETNLRSFLENAVNFVVYRLKVDPSPLYKAEVTLVSPSIKKLLGVNDPYRLEEWFKIIHPDDYQRAVEANTRASSEKEPFDEIIRFIHQDTQQVIWMHILSTPVLDESGRLTHFNGLMVDVSQQKRAEEALQRQLAFENIITSISTSFINLGSEEIDAGINQALADLGKFAGVDRSYVFQFSPDGQRMTNSHEWCASGISNQKHRFQDQAVSDLPWFTAKIKHLHVVHAPKLIELPAGADLDVRECRTQSIQSLLLVPMIFRGQAIGFLGFNSVRTEKRWSEDYISLLRIVGEIFVNALERKRTQEALQESQQLLQKHIEERTHELTTLLDLSKNLAATIDLEPQLNLILEQLKSVVDFVGSSILKLSGNTLKLVAYRGPIPYEEALQFTFSLESAGANRTVIENRQPVIIPDVKANTPMARMFRDTAGEHLDTTFSYIRSWLGVPLIVRDQVIGMMSLDHPTPGYYKTTPHSQLAMAFANQVAAAIENARLYAEVRQRADEAQTLFAVQQAITSRLNPDDVLQMIANEARRLTNTTKGAVYLLRDDQLEIGVVSGEVDPQMLGYHLPIEGSVAGLALKSGRPYLINDAQQDERVHEEIVRRVNAESFIIVPLMSSTGPIGTITVANKREGVLGAEDERVLTMLASGAVVAIENARLYQEEQERRREAERRRQVAEGLRDILAILNSNRPLTETLNHIVQQAVRLMGSDAGVIYHLGEDHANLRIEAGFGLPEAFSEQESVPVYEGGAVQAMLSRKPYVVSNIPEFLKARADPNQESAITTWQSALNDNYKAFLGTPLVIRDEVYGSLGLYYRESQEFEDEEIELAMAFTDQAALAIENARLRTQAERSAVAAERSRLARDLHDAVTQTLFSASLIAEVLPRLWERNPEEGQKRLEELRQLTRGALAEMRTLLLELRPAALVEADLSELFRHLADAFTSRARVPVEFSIEGDYDLPADVKVALYRIAQEALNNIAKHAHATQAEMRIHCEAGQVSLHVRDDGRGFDPGSASPESLGMGIMEERADNISAALKIESKPGGGTTITVVWKPDGTYQEREE